MITLKDTQQVDIAVQAADKKGVPAQVQGVSFSSSDNSIAAVNQDAGDPSKATVVAGTPGTAQITVTADADLTDGVAPLTGTLDIVVVAGDAVALSVAAGVPAEQV